MWSLVCSSLVHFWFWWLPLPMRTIGTSMFGLSATAAALYVSLYSITKAQADVLFGKCFQIKIGRSKTLYIIYTVVALALAIIAFVPGQIGFVVPGLLVWAFCFGVWWVYFLPLSWKMDLSIRVFNYGIVFSGYSIAAYFAPSITAQIAATNQEISPSPFNVAIVLALVGIVLMLSLSIGK